MKLLKPFAATCIALVAFTLTAQQPENDSQAQADQIRNGTAQNSTPPNDKPPMRVRALFKNVTGTVTVTFLLLPGQTLKLYDPYYDFLKITSDFPISLPGASCHENDSTDFECRNIPNDQYLIIDDGRVGVPPDSSPPNRVKFIGVHHRPSN